MGEDQHADGELNARENVIHELGLSQGNLGFTKAIALLEDSVGSGLSFKRCAPKYRLIQLLCSMKIFFVKFIFKSSPIAS